MKIPICILALLLLLTTQYAHSQTIPASFSSPREIKSYVYSQAVEKGVSIIQADWVVQHESQWNSNAIGDDTICHAPKSINYGKETKSRGLWQISSCWHPEVSDKCAMDVICSTAWSLDWIKKGHINEWSSWRFRDKWYNDPRSTKAEK